MSAARLSAILIVMSAVAGCAPDLTEFTKGSTVVDPGVRDAAPSNARRFVAVDARPSARIDASDERTEGIVEDPATDPPAEPPEDEPKAIEDADIPVVATEEDDVDAGSTTQPDATTMIDAPTPELWSDTTSLTDEGARPTADASDAASVGVDAADSASVTNDAADAADSASVTNDAADAAPVTSAL